MPLFSANDCLDDVKEKSFSANMNHGAFACLTFFLRPFFYLQQFHQLI